MIRMLFSDRFSRSGMSIPRLAAVIVLALSTPLALGAADASKEEAVAIGPALASKSDKIEQLVNLHDLKTSVAIGNLYLKQQTLLAVRGELAKMGKEQNLGPDWNPSNRYWKQAEDAVVVAATKQVNRRFSSMEWLAVEWSQLDDREFSEQDIDRLLTHFQTDYGRKQIMIVDHGVALHVQGALTFSGKMVYELPGSEDERSLMQSVYGDEDREMRFNLAESPEGVQFAMSPVGKRYVVNAVLKVSGMISRRLDDTAASIPQTVKSLSDQAQAAMLAFRRMHEG